MVEEKVFECIRTCEQYIQNSGEYYQAILNNCANFCAENDFGAAAVSEGLRTGLEVALVVLVIILVIIGLVVGFTKLKEDDEEEEDNKDYY